MTACTYLTAGSAARPSPQRVFDAKLERLQGTLDTVVANFSGRLAQLQAKVDSSADKARTLPCAHAHATRARGRAAGLGTY